MNTQKQIDIKPSLFKRIFEAIKDFFDNKCKNEKCGNIILSPIDECIDCGWNRMDEAEKLIEEEERRNLVIAVKIALKEIEMEGK